MGMDRIYLAQDSDKWRAVAYAVMGMDRIYLAQDSDKWRAVAYAVMKLWFP